MALNDNEAKQIYDTIVDIYDRASALINIIRRPDAKNPEIEAKYLAPFIEQMQISADVLVDQYLEYIENGQKPTQQNIKKIEGAIRQLFTVAETQLEQWDYQLSEK